MRLKNVLLSSISGILCNIVTLFLNFILRKIFLDTLGVELLGYDSLFIDLMGILNVIELGMGTALSINLYKPLAENDEDRIIIIFRLLKKVYYFISLAVLVLGLFMLFNLQYFVNKPISNVGYIRTIFSLYLGNTIINYLFSAQQTYLGAKQKLYILSLTTMTTNIISSIIRIFILIYTKDFILFLLVKFGFLLIGNMYVYLYLRKNDKFIFNKPRSTHVEDLSSLKKSTSTLVFQRLSTTVLLYTDSLIISKFLGLTVIGLFSNYKLIIASVNSLISQLLSSISVSFASFIAEKKEQDAYNMLNNLTFFCFVVANVSFISLAILLNPFIVLWLGDEFLFNSIPVYVSLVNFYILICITPLYDAYTYSHSFKGDFLTPILEILINVSVSLLLVKYLGITGVFVGTLACYIVGFTRRMCMTFKKYFLVSYLEYLKKQLIYICFTVMSCFIVALAVHLISINNIYIDFVIKASVSIAMPCVLVYIFFHKKAEFIYFRGIIISLIGKLVKRKQVSN